MLAGTQRPATSAAKVRIAGGMGFNAWAYLPWPDIEQQLRADNHAK